MNRRNGFTLIEVVVILAITAVLAGVLVPSVTSQMRKGQVNRVVADLNMLRSAAAAFFSDVNRYPGDVHDLANQVTASDADVRAAIYPAKLIAKWTGPYIDKGAADGDSLATGFGGMIRDDFTVNQHSNGVAYLTIRATGISAVEFTFIDQVLDDGDGTTAGRARFTASGDTLKYLAVPLQ